MTELTTAHRTLLSLDLTIAAMCKQYGDDVDKRKDYWKTEERRDAALKSLATIRARSPGDICAKAQALQQPDLEYSHHYIAIGRGLAADVLRYFSRAA